MKNFMVSLVLVFVSVVSLPAWGTSNKDNGDAEEMEFGTCLPSQQYANDPAHVCDYSIKLIKVGGQNHLQLLVNIEKDAKKSAVFKPIDTIRLPAITNTQLVGATSSPCTFEDHLDETFVALALFKDEEEFSVRIPFAVGVDEEKQKFFVYPDTRYISCENPAFYVN